MRFFFFAVLALIPSVAAFPAEVEVKDKSSSESREVADVREGPSQVPVEPVSVEPNAGVTVPYSFTPIPPRKGPQRHHPHYPHHGYYPYYGYGYYPYYYGHHY